MPAGWCGRGGDGGGLLDHGPQFRFLLGEAALELQVGLDLVGLVGKPTKFGGLLFRTLCHIGKFGHTGGDCRATILKTLEVACHVRPCSLLSRPNAFQAAAGGCIARKRAAKCILKSLALLLSKSSDRLISCNVG